MRKLLIMLLATGIAFYFTVSVEAGPKPSGNYILSEISDEIDMDISNWPWSALSRVVLSGQGSGTYESIASSDGDIGTQDVFNYKVYTDGMIKIFIDPQNEQLYFPGIVSPDSNYFALSLIDSTYPGIAFGIHYPATTPTASDRTYWAVQFSDPVENPGESQTANDPLSMISTISLNADGSGSFADLARSDCAAGPDSCTAEELEQGVFTYALDSDPSDGNLTITIDIPGEGTMNLNGIVSQDGSVFSFPFVNNPNEAGLILGIQKSGGTFTMDKTRGKYYLIQFDDYKGSCEMPPQDATWPWAGMGQITLDGQGNGKFKDIYTSDPYDEDFPESGTFTYNVDNNGYMTVTTDEGQLPGFVSSDGNLVMIAELDPCAPGILIGIKVSQTGLPTAVQMLLLDE